MEFNKIIQGNVLNTIKQIESKSVQCAVTSPPYWGLRDYGIDEQLGLEETPDEYVDNMVKVFREVKRVLRNDGTLWLNLGDSYSGNCSRASNNGRASFGKKREGVFKKIGKDLKTKDLVGIPWRVAFALQSDGWYLRQDIIWHKPNPMPESVQDRCTKSHEYIFLLSKSARYFYNAESIREPINLNNNGSIRSPKFGKDRPKNPREMNEVIYDKIKGANKRSVWKINTKPYKDAHFAVFPEKLPELCIKAGSKKGDIVLDPFFGSGTTGWVAQRLGRKWIGCELNKDYIKIAKKRFQQVELF
tara:strand:- start:53 stop:958 length:906 start_codon:yes stop_codon:yes gene_type:complete